MTHADPTPRPAPRSTPRFTIVIPLYNHARYIDAAIRSVLDQDRPADEIILIDDGSTDRGLAIAHRLLDGERCATVRTQPNAGAHVTLNRCIAASTGDLIAVLNSDDVFHPGKLARCAALFTADDAPDLVFGGVRIIGADGATVPGGPVVDWLARAREFATRTGLLPLSLLHENHCVTTSNMVFRRSLWERVAGFQPLRYCHDLDFLAAAARHGVVRDDAGVEHIGYRVHDSNTIKETLAKVRVEIGAVLASALVEDGAGLAGGALDPDHALAMLEMLRTKGLSDLVVTLAASYRAYPDRAAFYAAATSAAMAPVLMAAQDQATRLPAPPIRGRPKSGAPVTLAIEVSSFDKGGLEKVVLDTAVLFRERGFVPLVVSAGAVGLLGEAAAAQGIEVVRLPQAGRTAFYRSLLRARGVRLSMSHFSRTGYELFHELGIPNITFIHNVYAFLAGDALAGFRADDRFVDTYISVSPNATRYATRKLGIDPAKVVTVPNGLVFEEHERRAQAAPAIDRASLGLLDTDTVLLNVASYNLHKGHYLMARAMELLLQGGRRDIKVVCVGNEIHAPHVAALRAHLQARRLERHILLPGYIPDVAAMHRMSDAFLLPSFIEGWSIAMNEAMFHAKPMILSDTGGSAEVIEDEDTGILIPNEYGDILDLDAPLLDELAYAPHDYQTAPALAAAMARVADSPLLWQLAGQRGRAKVLARYGFPEAVDRYVTEMRRLLEA